MASWNYYTTIMYLYLAVLYMLQTDNVSPQNHSLYHPLSQKEVIKFVLAINWVYNVAFSPSSMTTKLLMSDITSLPFQVLFIPKLQ
jgi:hypothetical protein